MSQAVLTDTCGDGLYYLWCFLDKSAAICTFDIHCAIVSTSISFFVFLNKTNRSYVKIAYVDAFFRLHNFVFFSLSFS